MTQRRHFRDSFELDFNPNDEHVDIATTAPSALASSSKGGIITPHQTLWCRNGWLNAKVYPMPQSSLISDGSRGLSNKSKDQDISSSTPLYSIRVLHWAKKISLYVGNATMGSGKGDEIDLDSRPIIDVDLERMFTTTSTLTYWDTQKRVQMYRAQPGSGVEPDGLMSRRRTFDDFDGNKYKWSTSLFGDQECRRVSDGALIASFKKAKLSMNNWGEFTLHQAVSEMTFHLLLATNAACYENERQRD